MIAEARARESSVESFDAEHCTSVWAQIGGGEVGLLLPRQMPILIHRRIVSNQSIQIGMAPHVGCGLGRPALAEAMSIRQRRRRTASVLVRRIRSIKVCGAKI